MSSTSDPARGCNSSSTSAAATSRLSKSPWTIQFEPLARVRASGLDDLIALHWDEVALDKDKIPLDVDWSRYEALERIGAFYAITMRRGYDLIGYSGFITAPHLHYRSTPYAVNDVFFVAPYERGIAGVRLLQESERLLRGLGVRKVVYHTKLHVHLGKPNTRAIVGRLLERLGYRHIEEVHAKLL